VALGRRKNIQHSLQFEFFELLELRPLLVEALLFFGGIAYHGLPQANIALSFVLAVDVALLFFFLASTSGWDCPLPQIGLIVVDLCLLLLELPPQAIFARSAERVKARSLCRSHDVLQGVPEVSQLLPGWLKLSSPSPRLLPVD
jgi:hypothetical protein